MNLSWIFCLTIFASFHLVADAGFKTFRDMVTKHIHPHRHTDHVRHSIKHPTSPAGQKKVKGYIVQLSSPLIRVTREEHGLPLWAITNDFTLRRKFSSSAFLGCSFHLEDHSLLDQIRALPAVVKVSPIKMIPPPRIQTPILLDEERDMGKHLSEYKYLVHEATGVKKLHEQGIKGRRDILVCAVDTGVDYTLKALGGCFGPSPKCKIVVGEDLVGRDFKGHNDAVRGGPPLDQQGHGTHVSGIIIAEADQFVGVAPSVSLGMWKVFGPEGDTSNDALIEGIIAAKEAGCNVISLSLGGPNGWSEELLSTLVSNLADEGIFMSVALGNDGDLGLFASSSPADGLDVVAVGGTDSPGFWGFPAEITPENSKISSPIHYYRETIFSLDESLEVYVTSYNATVEADACEELPQNTPDLSKRIALIHRGKCPLSTKFENIQKKGANIYNNNLPLFPLGDIDDVKAAMITASDGKKIIKALNKGQSKVFFSQSDSQLQYLKNEFTRDLVSSWSSMGPLFEQQIKPDILAPGGNILSTFPKSMGGVAVISGTSMATPYIAGVAGLFQSVHGASAVNPLQLRDILVSTANQVNFYDQASSSVSNLLAPVIQAGGGLVQAHNAIKWSSRVHPTLLQLNDSTHARLSHQITIENHARKEVKYSFSAKGAGAIYTLPEDSIYPQTAPLKVESSVAVVVFSVDSLTIPAGNSATLSVDFKLPHDLNISRIPFHSGYVTISSSLRESFGIPYLGTTSNMNKVQLMEQSDSYPYLTDDMSDTGKRILENSIFKIGMKAPTVVFSMAMGSSLLTIQVFNATKITDTILQNGDLSNTLGENLPDYPSRYLPRYASDPPVANVEIWNGTLASGQKIKPGSYKILISALKIFGKQNNPKDWERWWSVAFIMEE
ncbi:Minor extracellular protease vpr [Neolecta irregularis DAH-3]|uniref:Minor extracellular protease vpr n=1 Tax=Neolecta irregularis (strain DAH-3) TaxID=1198029 RepID=A0A1U7LKU2_NEOID|nr:Minor extracellular protease vpr [Neolecta irregularis DAH-3]|eukprot:OLL23275.1 Minor extracellular protease vpr [Neolecta irregularis DAH-3]